MISIWDYIKKNESRFTTENMFCYVEDKKKPVVFLALYRDLNTGAITVYRNIFDTQAASEDSYLSCKQVDEDGFIEIKRSDWKNMYRKSVKNSISPADANYNFVKKEIEKNGGRLVKLNTVGGLKPYMLIAASSTDEDYYYILVRKPNGDEDVHIDFTTCCSWVDYIDEKDYGEEEYELLEWIKGHKGDIVRKISSYDNDVLITGYKFGGTEGHYKRHKPRALEITMEACRKNFKESVHAINELERKLNEAGDPKTTSIAVKMLNRYLLMHYKYIKPSIRDNKSYSYIEYEVKRMRDISFRAINRIRNEEVRTFSRHVIKCFYKKYLCLKLF